MVLGQLAIHMRKKENKSGFRFYTTRKNHFQIDKTWEEQLQNFCQVTEKYLHALNF